MIELFVQRLNLEILHSPHFIPAATQWQAHGDRLADCDAPGDLPDETL